MSSEQRQTVAGAYAKIEAHEDICALRYNQINQTLADLKGLIRWILGTSATIGIAIFGWMAVQLYNGKAPIQPVPVEVHNVP